jgi:hypothetical protein
MNTLKTQDSIVAELDKMNNAPINYSDIHPMTEEEQKTSQLYYKDFLDKLPPEMVKELVQRRLSEIEAKEPQCV